MQSCNALVDANRDSVSPKDWSRIQAKIKGIRSNFDRLFVISMMRIVESYSATVKDNGGTLGATSATMPVALYTWDQGSPSFCSAALLDVSDWTEVTKKSKARRSGRPPSMQGSTEGFLVGSKVKE